MLDKIKELPTFSNTLHSLWFLIFSCFLFLLSVFSRQQIILLLDTLHIFSSSPIIWLNTHTNFILEIIYLIVLFTSFTLFLCAITINCPYYHHPINNILMDNCELCFYIMLFTHILYSCKIWKLEIKDIYSFFFQKFSFIPASFISALFSFFVFMYIYSFLYTFVDETRAYLKID